MKRLISTALLMITLIMAISTQAATCTAVNDRGMHWTFTFPNPARASSTAFAACARVSSHCHVHCY